MYRDKELRAFEKKKKKEKRRRRYGGGRSSGPSLPGRLPVPEGLFGRKETQKIFRRGKKEKPDRGN